MKPRYRKTKNGGGYYYYILCESRRDSWDLLTRYELMNVGRHDDFTTREMDEEGDLVTAKSKGEPVCPASNSSCWQYSTGAAPMPVYISKSSTTR
ncbi:MAG: hypothetical protein K5683_02320 [Prevotella sp.]|nr:hypothetical protein [Prevotella sp.]